ncbi:hypothetical protein [Actinocrispum sp. NPDC049592]|uniref:hypothetical protein n=1 Tax=Actinocrispum sp. NPDC049592 TaxID=3154835 RepID=UPI0034320F5D
MSLVDGWTGRSASALQAALRMSNELFAQHLGIAVRTVASWHQKPDLRPKSEIQQILDTSLEQASSAVKERFGALMSGSPSSGPESRLTDDPNITAALDWLDHHADRPPGASGQDVAARLRQVDVQGLHNRGSRRGRVDQRRVADALSEYYRDRPAPYGLYSARFGDTAKAATSILTRPEWVDLACPLLPAHDRLTLTGTEDRTVRLDEHAAGLASQRLAETLALGIRMVDMPLYQLRDVDISPGGPGRHVRRDPVRALRVDDGPVGG